MLQSGKKIKIDKIGGIDMVDKYGLLVVTLVVIIMFAYILDISTKIGRMTNEIEQIWTTSTNHDMLFIAVEAKMSEEKESIRSISAEVMDLKYSKSRSEPMNREVSYTIHDILLLSRLVEAEAGICDLETKTAVASVVINRVKSSQFLGKNIHDVIYEKGQFQVVTNGRIDTVSVTAESRDAAITALTSGPTVDAVFFLVRELSSNKTLEWIDNGNYELVAKMDKEVEFYKVVVE